MLDVISVSGPIFVLIAVGFFAVRFNVYPAAMLPGLGRAILFFGIPGVILDNLLSRSPGEVFDWQFIGGYAVSGLFCLGLLLVFQALVMARKGQKQGCLPLVVRSLILCSSGFQF